MPYSYAAVEELNGVVSGRGGVSTALIGGEGPFYAGLHREPSSTLLEAVLTFLLAGDEGLGAANPYAEVILFAAAGEHLPKIQLGSDSLGQNAAAWRLRGSAPAAKPPISTFSSSKGMLSFDDFDAEQKKAWNNQKLLFRAQGMEWSRRLERALAEIEQLCRVRWGNGRHESTGKAPVRGLIIFDSLWLLPSSGMREVCIPPEEENRKRRIEVAFQAIPKLLEQGSSDLVVLCSSEDDAEALKTGAYLQRFLGGEYDQASEAERRNIPKLIWDKLIVATMPLVSESAPWGAWLPHAQVTDSFYRSLRTVIPVSAEIISEDPWDPHRIRQLLGRAEEELSAMVMGQTRAIKKICEILKLEAAGIDSKGPRAVLMFGGPTGVGKTQLARSLAVFLFGDEDALCYEEMNQYVEPHSVARLFGAPPGYQGSERGGRLTTFARNRPKSVILLDEIEKAHTDVYLPLMSLLREGEMAEASTGERVSFRDCIIILTSNLGASRINPGMEYQSLRNEVLHAVKDHFDKMNRPEILQRVGYPDDLVAFDFIRSEVALQICDKFTNYYIREFGVKHSCTFQLSPNAREVLYSECCSDLSLGAAQIEKKVKVVLARPLADAVLRADAIEPGLCYEIGDLRRTVASSYELELLKVEVD